MFLRRLKLPLQIPLQISQLANSRLTLSQVLLQLLHILFSPLSNIRTIFLDLIRIELIVPRSFQELLVLFFEMSQLSGSFLSLIF